MGSNPVALAINYNVMENINKLLGQMEIIDIVNSIERIENDSKIYDGVKYPNPNYSVFYSGVKGLLSVLKEIASRQCGSNTRSDSNKTN